MDLDPGNPPAFGGAYSVPLVAVPPPPPAPPIVPTRQEALAAFSDILFDVKDQLKEGVYIELCKAAQQLSQARNPPAPAPSNPGSRFEEIRGLISVELDEMRTENDGLEAQLDSATVTIDRLRERRKFYSKTTAALKGLIISKGVCDEEVLAAYERVGVKQEVLKDRDNRKRARDTDHDEYDLAISE